MKRYSCGLIFNQNNSEILLIRKNRPANQIGMFNGIGGKTEEGETILYSIIRESHEETTIKDEAWISICDLKGKDFYIGFYAIYDQDFSLIQPLTDEYLYPMKVKDIFDKNYYFYNYIMPNLRVVISLALDNSGIILPILLEE
jgi:8-oxo-dGTP diphosphatase